jgi:soluble lytic murein transglycosylase-like protein
MGRKTLLDEISALDHLHFSKRARKRARRRMRRGRLAIGGWMLLALLAVFGIKASDPTLEFAQALERTLLNQDGDVAQASTTTQTSSKAKARAAGQDRVEIEPHVILPTPTPSGGEIHAIIRAAAAEFGVSADYLLDIAECESTFNPNAFHSAGYHGLFQFDHATWGDFGYGNIYDPVAQARTTARLIKAGESHRWPICGLR